MKHILLKATFWLLLAAVMVYLLPTAAWGQENTAAAGDFTVTGDAGHYFWDDTKKELKITGDIEVKNTNPDTPTGHTIKVVKESEGSPIIVTLSGVNIDATIEGSSNTAAMDVSDSFVTVKLQNANSLKSRDSGAGLQKNGDNGSLTIESVDGGNNHSLKAEGNWGAGIGSVVFNNAHNITINSGKIEAYGDGYAAGIGGGQGGSTSNITINGGHIIARGSENGCGIGAGHSGTDTNIHITGGYIEAFGDQGMNGVGANNATGTVISGGTLIVKGGWYGTTYGIGGMPSITGGSIRLASDAPKDCKLFQNQPENIELKEITINNNAALEGLSFMDTGHDYNIKDVVADDKGKVYLYVPKGAEVKSVTYSGSEKFPVTFDEQYNDWSGDKKSTSFVTKLFKPNDPTRYYYTFKGWFTSADCKEGEEVKDWNTEVKDAVTYYAKWAPNTFTFTGGKKEFTYGENVGWNDLNSYITEENGSAGSKTFTITSGSLPDGLELYYRSYLIGTPTSASPTEEGSTIQLKITSNDNGYSIENQPLTIYIKKHDLTVTPDNSQTVYKDENLALICPTYQVTEGLLSGQTACFTGSLQMENNLIVRGSLALADGEAGNDFKASNYNLIVATDVPITVLDQSLDEAVKAKTLEAFVASKPEAIKNGWINAHGDITITAPAGYKVQPVQNNRTDNWGDSYAFALDADGDIPVPFQIRNETSSKIYDRSFTLKTDATAPTIGQETTKDLTFSVPLADATSGIASYIWQLNDGAEETVTLSGFPQSETFTHSGKEGENTLLLSVTDQAGNTLPAQTITFSLTAPVDPPVNPDPTPVYHTVTLPSVEGATTNPVAGEYEVEAYSSFRFYLTLDKGYDQSEPVVTTDRDETITPRSSDGAYIVKFVSQPIKIRIDGIIKNPDAVGNEVVATDAVKVWAIKGNLHISTVTGQTARVYNLAGALVKQAEIPAGDTLWPLPSGIYIVQIADTRYKVIL